MSVDQKRDRVANELVLISAALADVSSAIAQLQPWQHAIAINDQSTVHSHFTNEYRHD